MDSNTVILAIDLGKFHSVFCWYDPAPNPADFRKGITFSESFGEIFLGKSKPGLVGQAWSPVGRFSSATGDFMDRL